MGMCGVSVRVGVGGVVIGASLSFPGPGAVAAAPLPPWSRPPFAVSVARRLASRIALSSHAPPSRGRPDEGRAFAQHVRLSVVWSPDLAR